MVCRSADVGPNGLPNQIIWVWPEFFPQQCFHGWPDTVNDRPEVPRVVFRRTPKFLQGGQNSPTLGVAQHHDESCAEPFRGELDAADLRRGHDVSCNTDDKQVTETLIEDDLSRHPRIGTSENDGKRLLACRQPAAAHLAGEPLVAPDARNKATVPLPQAFECFSR